MEFGFPPKKNNECGTMRAQAGTELRTRGAIIRTAAAQAVVLHVGRSTLAVSAPILRVAVAVEVVGRQALALGIITNTGREGGPSQEENTKSAARSTEKTLYEYE